MRPSNRAIISQEQTRHASGSIRIFPNHGLLAVENVSPLCTAMPGRAQCPHIRRSTLAKASKNRDWRIYAGCAQRPISLARPPCGPQDSELDLKGSVYALDSSAIDLCLSLFPRAPSRKTESGIKLHALLDALSPEPSSIYVIDRAYADFDRLHMPHSLGSCFAVRARHRRLCSHENDRDNGVI